MYNFTIANLDTDSIMVCKPDQSPFSDEETENLLNELNSLFPSKIKWADDGRFVKSIIFKTKNYVLQTPEGKIKSKGSAVKSPAKEQAIREFTQQTIQAILDNKTNFTEIYHKIVLEIISPTIDINRFATRKTLTAKTYESDRANESKIIAAIENTEYVEGNRIWVYFTKEGTLKLAEHYNGDHDPQVLLKKLYMTSKLFDTVLPTKDLYLNYSLKRNQKLLETLGNPTIREIQAVQEEIIDCPGWREIKRKYPNLFNKVYNLPNLLPPREKTFEAFKYFKPKDCKVIILNDKYTPLISTWAKQGVLMVDTSLFEEFILSKIQQIIDCKKPLVIVSANKLTSLVLHDKVNIIKDLARANEFLVENGITPIDWSL